MCFLLNVGPFEQKHFKVAGPLVCFFSKTENTLNLSAFTVLFQLASNFLYSIFRLSQTSS